MESVRDNAVFSRRGVIDSSIKLAEHYYAIGDQEFIRYVLGVMTVCLEGDD